MIEQHQESRSHRMATGQLKAIKASGRRRKRRVDTSSPRQTLSWPELWHSDASLDRATEDDALLKGNVPSAHDWKDAWSLLTERCSLRAGARMFEKKHGQVKADPLEHKKRKRYRRQLRTMAELIRRRIREVLRQATSISLSLDEWKYQKIIRFRADLPSRQRGSSGSLWRHVGASGFCAAGVLGILDCSKKHAEDFEEDHAITAVKQLDDFLTRFCTPLGRVPRRRAPQPLACDEALKKHILEKVFCIAADGAAKERRAVFLTARELFPNLLIVIRDPAHAIRLAIKALHCDDVFGEVWHELFDKEHALVPNLMHSAKWHNLLVAIQEDNQRVVARPGELQQPMAEVLRNVAFAKQRFDSTADPVAKVALMTLPLATLLAHTASDRRVDKPKREAATALLQKLDTQFCTAIGVSADWGLVCTWFLRLFDEAYHDIAKSRSQIDCMLETLDAVFVKGRVFQDRVCADPGAVAQTQGPMAEPLPQLPDAGGRDEVGFITAKVLRNLRKKYVFYAGGVPVLLWGEPQDAVKRNLLERLQNVSSLMKKRLQADFPRTDARSALAIFDRRLVLKGFGPQPVTEVKTYMRKSVARLASLLGLEQQAAVLQYDGALPYMIAQSGPNQPLAGLSNQQAWALLLDDGVWEKACPKRHLSASGALRAIIRFYISIEDGECTVERDLAEFREAKCVHRTDNMDFFDDMLMLKLNGPKTLEEYGGGEADSCSRLTPFSRECASLWRELYGACFGHYNAKATLAAKIKKKKQQGFRKTVGGVLAASRLAVAESRRVAARGQASDEMSLLSLVPGPLKNAFWNESMDQFQDTTNKNIPGVVETRCRPGGPFIPPAGVHLERKAGAIAKPTARPPLSANVAFLMDTGRGQRNLRTASTGTHRCADADLVIVPDLSILHDTDALAGSLDLAVCLVYIVSLGLSITTQKHWDAARGRPENLGPLACVRHVALARQQHVTFQVGSRLRIEKPDVHRALGRIMRSPQSKFTLPPKGAAAPGAVCFDDLQGVVAWACSVRRTLSELGPKTYGTDGVAMPT